MNFLIKPRLIAVRILTKIIFKNKKPYIEPSSWTRVPKGGVVRSPNELVESAVDLLADAQASGYSLTIKDESINTFGMGHTKSVVTINNSYERTRAIMDNSTPEVALEPISKTFNIFMQATQTRVDINTADGAIQRLVMVGPYRDIEIRSVGWPVMLDTDPGYSQVILILENAGNYNVKFHESHIGLSNSSFVFSKDGKDIILFKSRGFATVRMELFALNII